MKIWIHILLVYQVRCFETLAIITNLHFQKCEDAATISATDSWVYNTKSTILISLQLIEKLGIYENQ